MIAAAFLIGFFGSVHCVGMCGPLSLALPLPREKKLGGVLLYNSGRILTYCLLGALFGLVGSSLFLVGWQKAFSVVLAAAIILMLMLPQVSSFVSRTYLQTRWVGWVRHRLQEQFSKRSYLSAFFSGIFNGFLPCGLVYVAIAGALASETVAEGIFYMVAFGAGTLPAMLLVNLAPLYFFRNKKFSSRWVLASLSLMASLLLLYRGLLLDLSLHDALQQAGHRIMTICR